MAFLTKIVGVLLTPLLDWIVGRVTLLVQQWRAKHEDEVKNEENRKNLEKGETPEEREKSTADIIGKF